MVSKRQREARKRFKESNPELLLKPVPKPCKDPIKTKKKLAKLKRKLTAPPKDATKAKKSTSGKKHPLRVIKPGDSCFICKSPDHIAKNCPEKAQWEKNKICLFCRARGHSLKVCPKKNGESMDQKLCYNCGDSGHSLDKCPRPLQDGGTSFASCFVCNQQGHLSKNCPKNTHGIYPKGGSCNICDGVTHLARDCPERLLKASHSRQSFKITEEPTGQVTRFTSGDDLEDDFTSMEKLVGKDKKSSEFKGPASTSEGNNVKVKKCGPKVVNFLG